MESDASDVSIIDLALFPYGFSERQLIAELRAGSGHSVWIENKLAGYILMRRKDQILEVTRLAVLPEFQHQGVGSALLELAAPGSKDGVEYLTLHVDKGNVIAIRTYLRVGFHIVGEDGPNSWVMQKSLVDGTESSIPPSR